MGFRPGLKYQEVQQPEGPAKAHASHEAAHGASTSEQAAHEIDPQSLTPLTRDQRETLRNDIQILLISPCNDFVSSVLVNVATNTQRALYSNDFVSDPLKIFDAVASQKAFFMAPGQGHAGVAHGGLERGTAYITLDISFTGASFQRGLVALGEIIHEASGVGIDKYTDRELAIAGYQAAWGMGYDVVPPPRTNVVRDNSNYFHNTLLFMFCSPNQQKK